MMGLAFGVAMLRTSTGWILGAAIFVVGMVGFFLAAMPFQYSAPRGVNELLRCWTSATL